VPAGPAASTEEQDAGKKGKKKKGKKEKKKKGNRSCGAAEDATESSEEVALRQYFAKTADLSLHVRPLSSPYSPQRLFVASIRLAPKPHRFAPSLL
jgi:hypothetical protein